MNSFHTLKLFHCVGKPYGDMRRCRGADLQLSER